VFHGAKDETIPLDRMKEMAAALCAVDGHPMFTFVPDGAHWQGKITALHEPNFSPWMFAQRRGTAEVPFEKVSRPKDKRPTSLAKR
jgi:hypothetical protein